MKYQKFIQEFSAMRGGMVYVEDSILWYCLQAYASYYLSLGLHRRINFKQSFFDIGEGKQYSAYEEI